MKYPHTLTGAALALAVVSIAWSVGASSHREAPAISKDPAADNTDLWAWTSSDRSKLWVVAAYNPLEEPAGGPNFQKFSDDVLYEIHISRGDQSLKDAITYQIVFTSAPLSHGDPGAADAGLGSIGLPGNGGGKEFFAQIAGSFQQTYSVWKVEGGAKSKIASGVPVAPPNIGPRTNAVAYGIPSGTTYGAWSVSPTYLVSGANGERLWAGPRDDGFYVDLARIFDLANYAGTATTPLPKATDGLAGFNCHAIALEIPTTQLTASGSAPVAGVNGSPTTNDPQTLGVWASASRRKVRILRADGSETGLGPWVQVSRQGLPLINEAVIGLQDKDKYNRTKPYTDVANFGAYFLNPVIVKDADAVGIYTQLGVPAATVQTFAYGRTDILNVINLTDVPAAGSHAIAIAPGITGDVLRVDLGFPAGFPNGRPIYGGTTKETDVTDIELNLLLAKSAVVGAPAGDGVNDNDAPYLADMPFLATPWEGATQGHGKTPTPNN